MNINLDLYKVFYCVAKNESITRASNELSISQPAISKSIKTLEEQINTPLFIRKRDGVELTEAGETIFNKIKEAMELIDSAEQDIKSLTNLEKGSINIGASKTIIHEFLMPYIKQFHKDYPNISIRIFTDKTSELIKKTKMGLVDVIFTNMPYNFPNDFESLKLMELHDCLVANDNFKHLKDKVINKKELDLYIMRRNMFRQAIALLQGISAQLDIFHDLYSSDGFSNHEYQELIGYTTELRNMISAVILYDKEKAEKLGLLGEDC